MYQYYKAWVRPTATGQYDEVDIRGMVLSYLFTQYDHIYLYLTHPAFLDEDDNPKILGLDLSSIQNTLVHRLDSIEDWLLSLGNASLPTDYPAKTRHVNYVIYQDARRAGQTLTRVYGHSHPDSEYPLDDKRNLLVSHSDDPDGYVSFHENHLVTLGGYLHRTEHTAHGVLVPHAVETLERSNLDTVGLVSFEQLGGVSQIHLTGDDIRADGNGNPLGRRFAIDFPEDIGDKSLGLVILGRLITDRKVFRKFNRTRVLVETESLDLEGLYQQVHGDLDLSSLPIEPVRGEADVVLIDQLRSDETIKAIMSLPQSFVVVFNAPRLVENFYPVANSDVSGRAFSYRLPEEPLIGVHGLYTDYWTQKDHGVWVLNFPQRWAYRYFHDTYSGDDRVITTGHHTTVQPRYAPHYRLHRLETQSLVTP